MQSRLKIELITFKLSFILKLMIENTSQFDWNFFFD